MDVLTEDVRDGSLMELLYADKCVLCGQSLNEVIDKYGRLFNQILKIVFFITKNVNCREISTKNLVTFKRWNEVKDENFEPPVHWKTWFLGEVTKKQDIGGIV